MTNEIIEQKYNNSGDLIVAEEKDGGRTMQEVKFGLIKLMGDKKEYRVSFKTLCDIEKSRQQGFEGNVIIKELGMSVKMSQIVMLKSEVEDVVIKDGFTNLPYESLILERFENGEFIRSNKSRRKHQEEGTTFWQCLVHYKLEGEEKKYLMEFEQLKLAARVRNNDGYTVCDKIYEYGVEKMKKVE